MASSGPNYSSTWASTSSSPYSGQAWVNVANLASGATLATITHANYDAGVNSYLAIGTTFGFSLPSAGQVTGITVEINGRYDAGTARIEYVSLRKDGALWGTAKTPAQAITSSLATYSFGGTSDQWGISSPTTDNINETDFGVAFAVQATSANTDISFDWARVTITYTENRTASSTFKVQLPLITSTATNTPAPREASSTFKIQLPLVTATATNAPPRSASSTFRVQSPLITSTATNTPPPREGSSTFRVQSPIITSTAENVPPPRDASSTFRVQPVLITGTATNVPPERSSSTTFRIQPPIITSTAENTAAGMNGSANFRVQPPIIIATVENLAPSNGSSVFKIQSALISATATNEPPPRSATVLMKLQLPVILSDGGIVRLIQDPIESYRVVWRGLDGLTNRSPQVKHSGVAQPTTRGIIVRHTEGAEHGSNSG